MENEEKMYYKTNTSILQMYRGFGAMEAKQHSSLTFLQLTTEYLARKYSSGGSLGVMSTLMHRLVACQRQLSAGCISQHITHLYLQNLCILAHLFYAWLKIPKQKSPRQAQLQGWLRGGYVKSLLKTFSDESTCILKMIKSLYLVNLKLPYFVSVILSILIVITEKNLKNKHMKKTSPRSEMFLAQKVSHKILNHWESI